MKSHALILGCLIAAAFATTAWPLTVERDVTPAYLREHPKEFSVKALKGENGLIEFTIKHNASKPMYHVARLAIYHEGRLIATSSTPLIGRKRDNTFHFALSPQDVSESRFSLSVSHFSGPPENAVPLPGSIINKFRLLDFAPKQSPKTLGTK